MLTILFVPVRVQLAKTPEIRKMLLDIQESKSMFGMLSLTSSINPRHPKRSGDESLHESTGVTDAIVLSSVTDSMVVSSAS